MEKLRFASAREEEARALVTGNAVTVTVDAANRERTVLKGSLKRGRHTYTPELIIDSDQRLQSGTCTCNFYLQNKLFKGPCACMLATRMAWSKKHAR